MLMRRLWTDRRNDLRVIRLIANSCWLVIFLAGITQVPTMAQGTKRALVFAIGDYPEAGGWPQINSLHDAVYIQQILQNQGFSTDNIKVVADKAATIEGIRAAFEQLIQQSGPGDIVVIHFSSHGERVEADNNDKIDGLDECVVTINAISPLQSTNYQKDQAQYLRGHVLGDYLKRIRLKIGGSGDLVIFMDNCYSGSGTRGAAKVRGSEYPFVRPGFDPKRHNKSDSSMLSKVEIFSPEQEKEMSPYEVFSATMPDEMDFETIDESNNSPVGSLTYALSKAFEDLRTGSAYPTYRSLFAKVQTTMNVAVPDQHPLLEGTENERVVFGGQFKHQEPYNELAQYDKDKNVVEIKGGEMEGLSPGASIAIFPAGTSDTTKGTILGRGKITKSTSFTSTALIDRLLPIKTAAEAWVFISEHNYSIRPITVRFAPGTSHDAAGRSFSVAGQQRIKAMIAALSFVQFGNDADIEIIKGKKSDSLKVVGNGYLFALVNSILQDSADFKQKLEFYARYKFLQSLKSTVDGIQVDIQLVPLVAGKPDTSKIKERLVNNTMVVYDGDTLTLRIRNTGSHDAYVNILDMQPDGIINPVLPNTRMSFPIYPQDLKILAGEEYYLPRGDFIAISPPYGTR